MHFKGDVFFEVIRKIFFFDFFQHSKVKNPILAQKIAVNLLLTNQKNFK